MKSSIFRFLVCIPAALSAGGAVAAGLGELRKQPYLGDPLRVEIELIANSGQVPAADCFRLKYPAGEERWSWVRTAELTVRRGSPSVLEVRSSAVTREPALRLGIELGCGSDVVREYVVLASPRKNAKENDPEDKVAPSLLRLSDSGEVARPPRPAARKPAASRPAPADTNAPSAAAPAADRPAVPAIVPAESVPPVANKTDAAPPAVEPPAAPTPVELPAAVPASPPAPPAPVLPPAPEVEASAGWWLYIAMAAGVLALLGVLFYRRRLENQPAESLAAMLAPTPKKPAPVADPLQDEVSDRHAYTLVERHQGGAPEVVHQAPVETHQARIEKPAEVVQAESELVGMLGGSEDSANPAMELAEIMLSFGRVKGAAQALQEFIDKSPQEALQPWIRLLDVYRMAGMREEFDNVARNLNKTFNVELQSWDEMQASVQAGGNIIEFTLDDQPAAQAVSANRPQSIEEMPRVQQMIVDCWGRDDAVEFMHGLLRDNGGGTRLGFPRPVVEEILFLIQLRQGIA